MERVSRSMTKQTTYDPEIGMHRDEPITYQSRAQHCSLARFMVGTSSGRSDVRGTMPSLT
jgi:hypothetical protein